jgi:alpha-amylase
VDSPQIDLFEKLHKETITVLVYTHVTELFLHNVQFYDHFYDWGLKEEIKSLIEVRKRNDIKANSKCHIVAAENDLYVATIDDRVVVKIGSCFNMGDLTPNPDEFSIAAAGKDYCVWERR